jgi:hypothetical protein
MPGPFAISRRAVLGALAAAGWGAACRAASVRESPASSVDELAERYVRLTLELAQHQPSLVDRWLGPPAWRPGPRRPVPELHAALETLQMDLASRPPGDSPERSAYLRHQVAALGVAARRLSGESLSFFDEARASLGKDVGDFLRGRLPHATSTDAIAPAYDELERRLPGRGGLPERYKAFRERHQVTPAQLPVVVAEAHEACRTRVRGHLNLPDAERVHVDFAAVAGLEAEARYEGGFQSRVSIAASGPLDVARIVWLVAHECYPGHHVQHVLGDRDLVVARGWQERWLHPSFGRHLLCAEGAAQAGAALLLDGPAFAEVCGAVAAAAGLPSLDWDGLVAVERAVTSLDLVIVVIAQAYLDGTIAGSAAVDALAGRALSIEARSLLAAIERRRTRVLAYPIGGRLVAEAVAAGSSSERWTRLAALATMLSLPASGVPARTAEAAR